MLDADTQLLQPRQIVEHEALLGNARSTASRDDRPRCWCPVLTKESFNGDGAVVSYLKIICK
jgi:hypothetical protein